jgi:hypothetical protein
MRCAAGHEFADPGGNAGVVALPTCTHIPRWRFGLLCVARLRFGLLCVARLRIGLRCVPRWRFGLRWVSPLRDSPAAGDGGILDPLRLEY